MSASATAAPTAATTNTADSRANLTRVLFALAAFAGVACIALTILVG